MAISLAEFSHNAVPICSTPNKLADGVTTSSLINGAHFADYDDEVSQVHLSPSRSQETEPQQPATSFLESSDEHFVLDPKEQNISDESNTGLTDSSSEFLHQATNESEENNATGDDDTNLTDYVCRQHATNDDEVSSNLKERLLLALTRLIPHRESLSLRLLVNYTVDGEHSECIVIDETLCRKSRAEKHKHSQMQGDTIVNTDEQSDSPYSCEPEHKRRRLHRLLYKDSPALDLSQPVVSTHEAVPQTTSKLESKANTTSNKTINDIIELSNESLQAAIRLLRGSNKTNQSDRSKRQVISSSGLSSGTGTLNGGISVANTTPTPPLIDPSVFSLFPLLQQQQQQQQKQQPKQPQHVLNSVNLPGFGENNFPNALLMPPEMSTENLLIKELQSLIQSTSNINAANNDSMDPSNKNCGSVHPAISNLTAKLMKHCEKSYGDIGSGSNTGAGCGGGVGGATVVGPANNPVNSTANSVFTLPLLNAFSADQLCSLFPPNPFISQSATGSTLTSAVKTSPATAVANIMQQQQQQQQQNTINPANNFTSFNIGSATLLNLRDKITGLETLGIMSAADRSLLQPMNNLLNQFSQNITSTPTSSASVSLRALSSLSQLFNSVTSSSKLQHPSPASYPSSLLTATPATSAMATTSTSSTHGPSINFPLPQSTLLPTSLNGAISSVTTTPTTMLTMLPSALPSVDMVAMLNSFGGTASPDKNRLVTLESLTAAVDRIKRQLPSSQLLSTGLDNIGDVLPAGAQSEISGLVGSPGSGGESFESSSPSTNNLMFGRRLLNARRFICNQCRRNYTSLAELNRHTLEAHNSFKCTICSAHFTQRSNLQRHSLKHVGFKPFTCNLCKKEYYRKDHLVRHIEVTHPNHDPKMNITVHLTSSECLEYLDRINTGKQTPSPGESEIQLPGDLDMAEEDLLKIDDDNAEESGVTCDEAITTCKVEAPTTDEPPSQTP